MKKNRLLQSADTVFSGEGVRGFLAAMLIFGIATGMANGVLNNFLHDILGISRAGRGIVEFPRELPGLLLFLIMGLLYRFNELRVMYFSLIVSFLGLLGLGFFGMNVAPAIVLIVLWSTGEHMLMPIRNSITLHLARAGKEGLAMGTVGSAGNAGQLAGYYLVPLIFLLVRRFGGELPETLPYRATYLIGALILLGGIIMTAKMKNRDDHVKKQKITFSRKFTRYYILEMFFGARKQVFLTFAPYVLIMNYGAKTEYIAFLYSLWSLGNIFLNPLLGRLMDKVGYKVILVADTVILFVLCLVYGFSHRLFDEHTAFIVVSTAFVLDAMLFMVGMARAKYVKTLSESKEEVTTALSAGISINHLISIVIAIAGGLLWESLGLEMLFSMAAFFGLGSFIFSLSLPPDSSVPVTE
ncbi:MAG: MFS transporter [Spirochaetales bacterium]|nr:MFS transporter [Spirochaetales bacterium]